MSLQRARNSAIVRRPLLAPTDIDGDVFTYVAKACFLEYVRTPRNPNLFRRSAAGVDSNVPSTELHVALLTAVRNNIRSYHYESSAAVVHEMMVGMCHELDKKDVRDSMKARMSLQALYGMFMQCCRTRRLVPAQVHELTLVFVDFLAFCNGKVKQAERTAVLSSLLPDMRRFYSAPPDPPLFREVAYVFCKPEADVRKHILAFSNKLSEKDYISDLARLSAEISAGRDKTNVFASGEDLRAWKVFEMSELSQMIKLYLESNKDDMQVRPSDRSDYVFLPPDPTAYYRAVVLQCFKRDLAATEAEVAARFEYSHPASPEFMDFFTPESRLVMRTMGVTWRIKKSTREIVALDIAREFYEKRQLSIAALAIMLKWFEHQRNLAHGDVRESWTKQDIMLYGKNLRLIYSKTTPKMADEIEHMFTGEPRLEQVVVFIEKYLMANDQFQFNETDFSNCVAQLKYQAKRAAYDRFLDNEAKVREQYGDGPLDLTLVWKTIMDMTVRDIVAVQEKYFIPQSVMGVDISRWTRALEIPEWTASQMTAMAAQYSIEQFQKLGRFVQAKELELEVKDCQDMYKLLCRLRSMYLAANSGAFPFDVEAMLVPYLYSSLEASLQRVPEWTRTIMASEKFEPMSSASRHSESVTVLFKMLREQIDVVKKLKWNTELHNAKLYTICMKSIARALNIYLAALKAKFRDDLVVQGPAEDKKMWNFNAKTKHEAFQFKPETCVKFNNLEYAKNQLDEIEKLINAEFLEDHVLNTESHDVSSYSFTITVVEAEDLQACDANGLSDPYAKLIDSTNRTVIGRTKTIYKDLNPIWNESFTYSVQKAVNIGIDVWDEDQAYLWNDEKSDHVGDGFLTLNPARHKDFEPLEHWIDLKPQGRIKIVTTMERERDDMLFYFGKTFRDMKQLEEFMVSAITEKFERAISHVLNLDMVRSVLKSGSMAAVKRLLNTPAEVPDPRTLDANVDAAIGPLLDYLADNFTTLASTLTRTLSRVVILETWNSVLRTLEYVVVPPLARKVFRQTPLTDNELNVVYSTIDGKLLDFFHQDGNGPSVEVLKSSEHYKILELARAYYHFSAAQLESKYYEMFSMNFERRRKLDTRGLLGRAHTIVAHKNLAAMKETEKGVRMARDVENTEQVVLRVLAIKDSTRLAQILKDRRGKEGIVAAQTASRRQSGQVFSRVDNMPQYRRQQPRK